jgi:hypothetical protein
LSIGNLAAGKSSIVNVDIHVPPAVRKLGLTESGTFADSSGKILTFSPGQVVFP